MTNKKTTKLMEFIADFSLLGIALLWGSTFIIVKNAIIDIPAFSFLSMRFGLASIILILISLYKIKQLNLNLFKDGIILGIALFSIFAFQTLALKYTSASIIGFLTGLYVIFTPILSIIFLKKYPHLFSLIGVVLAFLGMCFIAFVDLNTFSIGEIFGLLNAFFIAVHILLTDKFSPKHDALLLTTIQISVVAVLSILFSLITEPYILPEHFSSQLIFAIILTGLFATVLAFFIQTFMQKYTTPTKAALMFVIEPVSSAFFSYFIGAELLLFKQYVGAAFIILATIIAETGTYFKIRKSNA
jgi:drug/metabolite transporter (DMT)-like permease